MNVVIAAVAILATAPVAFGLGGVYPPRGTVPFSQLASNSQFTVRIPSRLIDRDEYAGGYWVNAEDTFYFKGDKTALERFLKDYVTVTNVFSHTLIQGDAAGPSGPPWDRTLFGVCDWALHLHPHGYRENYNPPSTNTVVMWIEVRCGGLIPSKALLYELEMPQGMQMLHVEVSGSKHSEAQKFAPTNGASVPSTRGTPPAGQEPRQGSGSAQP